MALLREECRIFRERGTAETNRMRGWVLFAFGEVGLPAEALPFVLEELESGHDAYVVAAAARALRGCATPSLMLVPFVQRAIRNVQGQDDRVSFERYGACALPGQGTTAMRELEETLAWLEASAEVGNDDCCAPMGLVRGEEHAGLWTDAVEAVPLEDHDGRRATFGELFRGRPSIVAFFYTRCDNPRKCSLTITKLSRVQVLLANAGLAGRVRTAAITYDPTFDSSLRLRVYGEARGMRLDDDHRMLRSTVGLEPLREAFDLGVGFVGSLVNRHRTEIFVLDANARVIASFARLEWKEEAVVARVKEMLHAPRRGVRAGRALLSALPPVAVAFFPKCPLCWAAYLSVFGIAGLERIPYTPWLLPGLAGLMLAVLASSWQRGRRRGAMSAFCFTVAGTVAILVLGLGLHLPGAAAVGVVLNMIGALLGSRTRSESRPERPPSLAARGMPAR